MIVAANGRVMDCRIAELVESTEVSVSTPGAEWRRYPQAAPERPRASSLPNAVQGAEQTGFPRGPDASKVVNCRDERSGGSGEPAPHRPCH